MAVNQELELLARKVIATSIAYYGLDVSLVEDTDFDQWCKTLFDHWDELEPWTQWKLGDPHSIQASGFHIKASVRDIHGTIEWLRQEGHYSHRVGIRGGFKEVKFEDREMRYAKVGDVQWDKSKTIQ